VSPRCQSKQKTPEKESERKAKKPTFHQIIPEVILFFIHRCWVIGTALDDSTHLIFTGIDTTGGHRQENQDGDRFHDVRRLKIVVMFK
jgi:hypothetical protein